MFLIVSIWLVDDQRNSQVVNQMRALDGPVSEIEIY